ncbi:serine/threonine-protein kinase ZRK1-like [Mangifera indica]|uniref:serine/threonine-protein kinase ZRK1-like n=1 Tax=Mangifera indica TaxID=29780 RepID=UPI001CF9E78C|nr:serine/threonine-protein kinase ZRK1-like [Mangifera indica]
MKWFSKASNRRLNEERFFENGKILLEGLIASCNGKCNPIRSFSVKEIKIGTNNHDPHNIMKDYGFYKLYRGSLQDRPVSVMKFISESHCSRKYIFNCIVFASQMRHKNFLKLIGCCLESELPVLVFECMQQWTLADRIYGSCEQHLSLTQRLKIAMEIADATAYLHCGFSRPIVSRWIIPSNIVFDGENVAKLFDFGESISIPEGETHIKDYRVVGTLRYLAPEYMWTGEFSEKLDVYSFGALLIDLLTGQEMHDPVEKKCIEQNRLTEIVDPIIVGTGLSSEKEELLQEFQELAFKCLSDSEEDRPTMVDAAKQLRKMYKSVCQSMS